MTFATPAQPGATGDEFACKDHLGELVVIEVLAAKPEVETKFGKADAISANVTVIEGHEVGRRYADALIFGSVIFHQLKGNVGERVLVRVAQGQKTGSNNPPWILDTNVTAEQQQRALQILTQASMGQAAPVGYQPPPAPPTPGYAPPQAFDPNQGQMQYAPPTAPQSY